MSISTLRDTVRRELTSFAWDQWAQLGVLAPSERHDHWAADPEALLLFGFEIGRADPRLFDELLDWLLTNERLVSVQRLRNLCAGDDDRELAEAALEWVGRQRQRPNGRPKRVSGDARRPIEREREPRPLFRTVGQIGAPDPAFLAFGLLKPKSQPSGKSQPPDLEAPVGFAFRLRQLFGVGSRAEVVRYLLTTPAADVSAEGVTVQDVTEAAGYAKRNVNETLAALVASGAVTTFELGNKRRYHLERDRWGQFLGLHDETWPSYRPWPKLLWALRRLVRWLEDTELEQLSPYMLASEARRLMDDVKPDLAFAGVPVPAVGVPQGEVYWGYFEQSIEGVVSMLNAFWA